jgi:hypothetical protein
MRRRKAVTYPTISFKEAVEAYHKSLPPNSTTLPPIESLSKIVSSTGSYWILMNDKFEIARVDAHSGHVICISELKAEQFKAMVGLVNTLDLPESIRQVELLLNQSCYVIVQACEDDGKHDFTDWLRHSITAQGCALLALSHIARIVQTIKDMKDHSGE